jgi:hypothetical protein
MTALVRRWNLKFVAIYIAYNSADEIGTSFSILYLPSKPLASQYTLTPLFSLNIEPLVYTISAVQ